MSEEETNIWSCYTARYENFVDDKRRLQIPAKWRVGQAETPFMLVNWAAGENRTVSEGNKDICLLVMPVPVANAFVQKLTAMAFSDRKAEALRRYLGENADTVVSDKSGRITLPERMTKAAGIEKEVLLIGMFDRFQIWKPARYAEVVAAEAPLAAEAFKMI